MRILTFILFLGTISLTACQDGPVEEMGESMDDAARDVGNTVEDACEDVTNTNC